MLLLIWEMWEWISVHCLPLLVITEYWSLQHYSCLFIKIVTHLLFFLFLLSVYHICNQIHWVIYYYLFFYWTRFKILPLLTNYCHVPLIIISLLWTFTMKIWLEIATMASPIVSVYNKYYNHSCFMCCGGLIRSIFWLWLQTQIVNDFNSCTVHVRRLFQQQP